MTCLIKYVFQIKRKIKVYMFLIWLQEKMIKNFNKKIHHVTGNVILIKKLIEIKSGIPINVDVSVKKVRYVKRIIRGTLLRIIVKMGNI